MYFKYSLSAKKNICVYYIFIPIKHLKQSTIDKKSYEDCAK